MKFWPNVQAALDRKRMAHRTLAAAIGVTPPAIHKYKTGTVPSLDVAARIAAYLGLSLDYLVWGQDGTPAKEHCPSPEEHGFLRELVQDLGMQDLVQLAQLGTKSSSWLVAEAMVERFPHPLTFSELSSKLTDVSQSMLRATLVALRRRGVLEEVAGDYEPSYRLISKLPLTPARELGDITLHLKRAVRMLFENILPGIEGPERTGHLMTIVGQFPRDKAVCLCDELNELIKLKVAEYTDDEPGDTKVRIVFGVAHSAEER